jgi:uncharacterized protein YkwD
MKKLSTLLISASLLVGCNTAMAAPISIPVPVISASTGDDAYSKEATEAMNYLNDIRAKMGVKAVQLDPFLMKAAQNHANYLASNKTTGHYETQGKVGFTGEDHENRVNAVGGKSRTVALAEVISYNTSDLKESIDTFFATSYHRQALIFQDATYLGIGIVGKKVVMEIASDTGRYSTSVVYPYDWQKDAPSLFDGFEKPNPLEQFGIATSGTPIYYSPEHFVDELEAVIKNSKGENVPFFKEKFLTGWFFYTKKPMTPGETYTVTTKCTPTFGDGIGVELTKTWSFTTAGGSSTSPAKPPVDSTRSASEIIAPASAVQQKANVTIDGVKQSFHQSAVIVEGSTLVPMRAIFEKLGATLKWDNNTQTATATKGDKTISISIGKENAFVNGRSVQLAAKAMLVNGNTMVPLRFVSEALGGSVTWDANTSTAHIISAGGVVQTLLLRL